MLTLSSLNAEAAQIVTANRNSQNISIIDVDTKNVFEVVLPGTNPEPMYPIYLSNTNELAVGDRSNNQVVFYNPINYSITGTVPTGNGVFHMFANPSGNQLWVNNDIDKTITVINPITKSVITTINIPPDIVANGGLPHDVILDSSGFAYVSILLPSTISNDIVIKYDTNTFAEVDRTNVGKDPHLSLTNLNNSLYVPTQGNNQVEVLNRNNLDLITAISVPGAHGVAISANSETLYISNISGGGINGLFAIDTNTNTILAGSPTNTGAPVPHNIALTDDGTELYISHSGATSNVVSYYSLINSVPNFQGLITVNGLNPFGITFVPSEPEPIATPESSSLLGLLTIGVLGITSSLIKKKRD
jgi:DNA-binding beta-propeller fold protein YncE